MPYPRTFTFRATAAYSGLSTVGYRLVPAGTAYTVATRVTTGVSELVAGTGCYVALASVPDGFQGHILWDTGGGSPAFSTPEEINPREQENADVKTSTVSAGSGGITIADVQTAMTSQGYTAMRATLLDRLDVAVSTRLAATWGVAYGAILDAIKAVTDKFGFAGANVLAAAQNLPTDYARPSDLDVTVSGRYTDAARDVLLAAIGAPQQAGEAVTLPNPAPPGYGGSGGGGGDGSYTDEDRTRDDATAARVAALGGKPVVHSDTVGRGGELTIRRGYARKRAYGNPIGPFTFTADLTAATMELRGIGAVSAFEPHKTFAEGKWSVSFDLDDSDAEGLQVGTFAYIVAAIYPDGSELDPVDRTSGVAKVV